MSMARRPEVACADCTLPVYDDERDRQHDDCWPGVMIAETSTGGDTCECDEPGDPPAYFHASPFVGEDDEADWKNYGGIWFCNGGYGRDSYGWVEDSRGLTEKEANAAAAALNGHPLIKSWRNLQDVDYDLVGEIVHGFWKENKIGDGGKQCDCDEPECETRDGGRWVICTVCGRAA